MRTIGLIGGMSWESSAEYYRIINQHVRDRLGPLRSAQLLMYSVDFGPVEQAQHAGRWDDAALKSLEQAAQCPAHPKILFDNRRMKTKRGNGFRLPEKKAAVLKTGNSHAIH